MKRVLRKDVEAGQTFSHTPSGDVCLALDERNCSQFLRQNVRVNAGAEWHVNMRYATLGWDWPDTPVWVLVEKKEVA